MSYGTRYCSIIALALLGAAPALATSYKCIDGDGRIIYQDAPCPSNMRGGEMSLNVNRPFTGKAKHSPTPPDMSLPAMDVTDVPPIMEPPDSAKAPAASVDTTDTTDTTDRAISTTATDGTDTAKLTDTAKTAEATTTADTAKPSAPKRSVSKPDTTNSPANEREENERWSVHARATSQ